MKAFGRFDKVINWTKQQMYDYCYEVHTERWQGREIKDDSRFRMIEILNHSFTCTMPETVKELAEQICPNLPWADDHFSERVSGLPLNPPPSHNWWPFAQKGNEEFGGTTKFSHTYPERIWPRYAGSEPNSIMEGIRFEYGDFGSVIDLLEKEPFTRQAFLPIWFPEDTGGANGERVPCSIGYHFIRRHDYLHVVYYIRSCDFFRHFRDDIYLCGRKVFWLIEQLAKRDPATWKGVKPGMLTMHITSLHAFANEKQLLKK